jgi:hypothetical protein
VTLYWWMPLDGIYAWKEEGLSPAARVDRFFNLIDHAVENGVPLRDMYRREHLKEFLLYLLKRHDEPCTTCTLRDKKGSHNA